MSHKIPDVVEKKDMCYNSSTSMGGLLLGSLVLWLAAGDVKQRPFTLLAVWWQFVLLVQFAEFLIWSDQACSSGTNLFGTRAVHALVLMQPLVLFLLTSSTPEVSSRVKAVLSTALAIYVFIVLCSLMGQDAVECTFPTAACPHLPYTRIKPLVGMLYGALVVACLLFLVKPFPVGAMTAFFFLLTCLVSTASCGQASVWCSFAVLGPLLGWGFCRLFRPYDKFQS